MMSGDRPDRHEATLLSTVVTNGDSANAVTVAAKTSTLNRVAFSLSVYFCHTRIQKHVSKTTMWRWVRCVSFFISGARVTKERKKSKIRFAHTLTLYANKINIHNSYRAPYIINQSIHSFIYVPLQMPSCAHNYGCLLRNTTPG